MIKPQMPLTWPADEPRTPIGQRIIKSPFSVTLGRTYDQLYNELERFKARGIVLSMNPAFRGKIEDTAVALYFELPGNRSIAICCDLYVKQDDNIRALLMIVESMRRIERYGGTKMSAKSFTGFAALPPPKDCWKTLGISKSVGEALSAKMRKEFIDDAFRDRSREGHADTGGSGGVDMAVLKEARDEARRQLGVA